MEEEAWSWPHVLVFQSLKRVAHSPLLNPANSRFLSALYASNIGICILSIKTKITISNYMLLKTVKQQFCVVFMCDSKTAVVT